MWLKNEKMKVICKNNNNEQWDCKWKKKKYDKLNINCFRREMDIDSDECYVYLYIVDFCCICHDESNETSTNFNKLDRW